MKQTNESSIFEKIKKFFKKIFFKEEVVMLPEANSNVNKTINKLDYIKVDTRINDLKMALDNGIKNIFQLSAKEIDKLIPLYEEEIKNIEKKIEYKKSVLQ